MYVKCTTLVWLRLDGDMFVADTCTTIKFRWYPRMRGQGWADFKLCRVCTCTCICAGVRCCIGTIGPCCGIAEIVFVCTLVAVHVVRHLPCILMRMCVCARSYVTMIMMCMHHCMCWRDIRMVIPILYLLCGMPGMALKTVKWVVEVVVHSPECVHVLLHPIHYYCYSARILYVVHIYDIYVWVCWSRMYVKCITLVWLDGYMFVAETWLTIKFRWYPRMRGQGWADFKLCRVCTCSCAEVHCCIGTTVLDLVVAQQELCLYICTLVAVHVVRNLPCILMRMYVCHIVCHYGHDVHVWLYVLPGLAWLEWQY